MSFVVSGFFFFFFQAEDGIRDYKVTGVQTCALPISNHSLQPVERRSSAFAIDIVCPARLSYVMRHSDSAPLSTTDDTAHKIESTACVGGDEGRASGEFVGFALYRVMDAKRQQRHLTWRQAAQEIWDQSATLNRQLQDHPMSLYLYGQKIQPRPDGV